MNTPNSPLLPHGGHIVQERDETHEFRGCSGYPSYKATLAVSPPEKPDQSDGGRKNRGQECPKS